MVGVNLTQHDLGLKKDKGPICTIFLLSLDMHVEMKQT